MSFDQVDLARTHSRWRGGRDQVSKRRHHPLHDLERPQQPANLKPDGPQFPRQAHQGHRNRINRVQRRQSRQNPRPLGRMHIQRGRGRNPRALQQQGHGLERGLVPDQHRPPPQGFSRQGARFGQWWSRYWWQSPGMVMDSTGFPLSGCYRHFGQGWDEAQIAFLPATPAKAGSPPPYESARNSISLPP